MKNYWLIRFDSEVLAEMGAIVQLGEVTRWRGVAEPAACECIQNMRRGDEVLVLGSTGGECTFIGIAEVRALPDVAPVLSDLGDEGSCEKPSIGGQNIRSVYTILKVQFIRHIPLSSLEKRGLVLGADFGSWAQGGPVFRISKNLYNTVRILGGRLRDP